MQPPESADRLSQISRKGPILRELVLGVSMACTRVWLLVRRIGRHAQALPIC